MIQCVYDPINYSQSKDLKLLTQKLTTLDAFLVKVHIQLIWRTVERDAFRLYVIYLLV